MQNTLDFLAPSKIVEFSEAQEHHMDYLKNGPYVMMNGSIVHCLIIKRADLEVLYAHGTGGVKLYFCSEPDDATRPCLSIIAVPFLTNGENRLSDPATGDSTIVNNLDPCPAYCPNAGALSELDLNYREESVEGVTLRGWYQPNKGLGVAGWRDDNGDEVNFPA